MPVIWRSQLSVGNDLIDRDHKYLICLFNAIELARKHPEDYQYLPIYFEQLFDYTKEHFDREERIQLKIEYPGYMEHKMQHQKIVAQLETATDELKRLMQEMASSADHRVQIAQFDKEIISLAREWVIDHLIKSDRSMTSYLQRFPKTLI